MASNLFQQGIAVAWLVSLATAQTVNAALAEYPGKSIRMIAPISAGGGADTAARLLARVLSESMRQQIVVDNRPGGGNVIGTSVAAKATPDGYTVLWVSTAHAINAAFERDLPYDSIRDFDPVALLVTLPLILVVNQSITARTVPELITLLRSNPGKFNYASSGVGSGSYLGLEMLKLIARVDIVNVSYKGAAPSLAALLGGEVQMAMVGPLSIKPHLSAGKLRPLAVTTPKRSSAFPDLPTLQESGVTHYEMTNWYGVLAPHGTPRGVIERLNAEVASAQKDKRLYEPMRAEGAEFVTLTPAQTGQHLAREIARYRVLSAALATRQR